MVEPENPVVTPRPAHAPDCFVVDDPATPEDQTKRKKALDAITLIGQIQEANEARREAEKRLARAQATNKALMIQHDQQLALLSRENERLREAIRKMNIAQTLREAVEIGYAALTKKGDQ